MALSIQKRMQPKQFLNPSDILGHPSVHAHDKHILGELSRRGNIQDPTAVNMSLVDKCHPSVRIHDVLVQ
jgi:hypothetical protein